MNEPLILSFILLNAPDNVDVIEVYGELENKLPCRRIDLSDEGESESGFKASSFEHILIFNLDVNLNVNSQLLIVAPIVYDIYKQKIKPLLNKNPNIKFLFSVHKADLDIKVHLELGEYRNKDEFIGALDSEIKKS